MEQKGDVRQNKMMAEIYLTRLLKTKVRIMNLAGFTAFISLYFVVFTILIEGTIYIVFHNWAFF